MAFPNKIWIGCDHAAFDLKQQFIQRYSNIRWQDMGPNNEDRVDYPDYANKLCLDLPKDHMGLLICGSGQGMAMAANKHPGIRGALCWDEESVLLARQHNNANLLCLGARLLTPAQCFRFFELFKSTYFEGGRHQTRLDKFIK